MIEETIVALLQAGEMREIGGKTGFQKLTYIIQREAQSKNIKGLSFNYEREDVTGGGCTVFVCEVTPKGTDTVKGVRKGMLIDSELIQTVNKVAEEHSPLPRFGRLRSRCKSATRYSHYILSERANALKLRKAKRHIIDLPDPSPTLGSIRRITMAGGADFRRIGYAT